ncbi:GxxExxY protein [Chitinophagaceae bacterium MMS25-I14]
MTENELSNLIIGSAIYVHQTLGPGLLESVYETCLCHCLINDGIRVEKQKSIPVLFEDIRMECGFRCDLLVEDKVIVEVKAVEALHNIHTAQVLTYLKLTNTKLGLLINFNELKVKDGIKRIVNNL